MHGIRRPGGRSDRWRTLLVTLVPAVGLLAVAVPVAAGAESPEESPGDVDFDRDVRPILSERCFRCHGPDESRRQADLRLDTRQGVFAEFDDRRVVVPGEPSRSEIYRRITSADDDERMPPRKSGPPLTGEEVARIRRWIEGGAVWRRHWAFVPPERPPLPGTDLPATGRALRARVGIDRFVLARLEKEGLSPSAEADLETLIRRVTLDLTGLPPTPQEVDAFLADSSPDAYERLVDRLLASPRYGERQALAWLDVARFADTSGYQTDGVRTMWRWRDWVIRAFNRNLPYDRFTVEQLAGDLLPEASVEQLVATGFNRNHRANSEGGIVFEEYLVEYAADRVDTTATVWMGLTLACARCHDHKYDPIRQSEFYRVFAFFNNIPERGRVIKYGNSAPFVRSPTPEMARALEALAGDASRAEEEFRDLQREIEGAQRAWESALRQAGDPVDGSVTDGLVLHLALDGDLSNRAAPRLAPAKESANRGAGDDPVDAPGGIAFRGGEPAYAPGRRGDAARLGGGRYLADPGARALDGAEEATFALWVFPEDEKADGTLIALVKDDDTRANGFSVHLREGRVQVFFGPRWIDDAVRVETREALAPGRWHHLALTYDGSQFARGVTLYVDGEPRRDLDVLLDLFTGSFKAPPPLRVGSRGKDGHFRGLVDDLRRYDRALRPEEVRVVACAETVSRIAALPPEARSAGQTAKIRHHFLEAAAPQPIRRAWRRLEESRRKLARFRESIPTTMVMRERDRRRDTFVLERGQYDLPGEKVTPGVPACLPPLPAGAPRNRLGFARWLVDPGHPLTARVAVNRIWQLHFGSGLVRTAEDFGTQGERPSHPGLLDWLATEFVASGWDVKSLHRLIVTSATYRQSSRVTPLLQRRDPEGRLLARAPRLRLSAEALRDQALAVSGLLSSRIGGPSVKPYQPAGLWKEIASDTYVQEHGASLYRRSLYTFWKRTVPPPLMTTFDATSRESCTVRRSRTNTPLQALALLNDVTYVEAARHLAQRMIIEGGSRPEERVRLGFRLVHARRPVAEELDVLLAGLERRRQRFRRDADAARLLIAVGESPPARGIDPAELAAYTLTASLLLNLDEAIVRE